mmetsp:Transcript_369/g.1461  ORF Transcript_369/g.1461 Transcript_369/m.1461 type:complete len:268 (-) Transcript_369:2649-3452(-)
MSITECAFRMGLLFFEPPTGGAPPSGAENVVPTEETGLVSLPEVTGESLGHSRASRMSSIVPMRLIFVPIGDDTELPDLSCDPNVPTEKGNAPNKSSVAARTVCVGAAPGTDPEFAVADSKVVARRAFVIIPVSAFCCLLGMPTALLKVLLSFLSQDFLATEGGNGDTQVCDPGVIITVSDCLPIEAIGRGVTGTSDGGTCVLPELPGLGAVSFMSGKLALRESEESRVGGSISPKLLSCLLRRYLSKSGPHRLRSVPRVISRVTGW